MQALRQQSEGDQSATSLADGTEMHILAPHCDSAASLVESTEPTTLTPTSAPQSDNILSVIEPIGTTTLTLSDGIPSANAEQLEIRSMAKSPFKRIWGLLLDLLFVALSIPSLLYAFTVLHLAAAPLQEHRRTAEILIQISHIVSSSPSIWKYCTKSNRVQRSFPFCSQP